MYDPFVYRQSAMAMSIDGRKEGSSTASEQVRGTHVVKHMKLSFNISLDTCQEAEFVAPCRDGDLGRDRGGGVPDDLK